MRVYVDVVFAINLIMDIFILWISGKIRSKHAPPLRIFLSGFVMSFMYCLLIFTEPLRQYMNIFSAILIMAVGVVICFRPKTAAEMLILIGFGHIAAFALGGIGMALFYYTNIGDVVGSMLGYSVANFSFKILISSTCIFYIIFKLFTIWQKNIALKKQTFYPVRIFFKDGDVDLTALVDTGNSLHDPISHAPVIIAEFNAVKAFLPDCLKLIFYEKKECDLNSIIGSIGEDSFAGRIRMIPFESIGKENGMLLGFRPDKVEIIGDTKTNTISDVIIGIYNLELSKEGRYQGLLSPELVNN